MRVLVVEDSKRLRESIVSGLRASGFAVDAAEQGQEGLDLALGADYDVIVLDILLPKLDGLSVLAQLRSRESESSVILLTARDTVEDRVKGLRAGADDYLVKPFAFDELVARVQTLARRRHRAASSTVRVDDMVIDTGAREVTRAGRRIELKPREYALLEYLAHRRGRAVSRIELEEHLYENDKRVQSNAIDSAVCSIRNKIEIPGGRPLIHTKRGVGYILQESPE